jgi:hypothetical protein
VTDIQCRTATGPCSDIKGGIQDEAVGERTAEGDIWQFDVLLTVRHLDICG